MSIDPAFARHDVTLYLGECVATMAELPEASVDAIVTDPPYGLEFMNKEWDSLGGRSRAYKAQSGHKSTGILPMSGRSGGPGRDGFLRKSNQAAQTWHEAWAREALRLLKPGGFLVAAGGTRTFHRLVCAIEDAGFEVRDTICWIHAQGFPKSKRVSSDPRFCQCAAPARSAGSKDREQPPVDHTGTAAGVSDGDPAPSGVRHSRHESQDSPAGCRRDDDSGDGLPLPGGATGLASSPSQECAPVRSRSDARADDLAGAPTRSPSRAQCSDHPSSLDSERHDSVQTEDVGRTSESTLPSDTYGSDHHKLGIPRGLSCDEYSIGFPRCDACGKPNSDGYGTALKPAVEFWTLARKPLGEATVAANVLKHGTGALNIDGCRIGAQERPVMVRTETVVEATAMSGKSTGATPNGETTTLGRWPANLILSHSVGCELVGTKTVQRSMIQKSAYDGSDTAGTHTYGKGLSPGSRQVGKSEETVDAWTCVPDCAVRLLDAQSGELTSGKADVLRRNSDKFRATYSAFAGQRAEGATYGDTGGASRFFFTAKADKVDRDGSKHPTIKPLDLMKWLVRLVAPPGALILDPFMGSGSTVAAARALGGYRIIGIDQDPASVEDAIRRLRQEVLAL